MKKKKHVTTRFFYSARSEKQKQKYASDACMQACITRSVLTLKWNSKCNRKNFSDRLDLSNQYHSTCI